MSEHQVIKIDDATFFTGCATFFVLTSNESSVVLQHKERKPADLVISPFEDTLLICFKDQSENSFGVHIPKHLSCDLASALMDICKSGESQQ